jgi:ribosome-associated toxin RatA of RatAB toxin-antitoxin module
MNSLGPMPAGAAMRTVDELLVRVPAQVMFELAADVERWPERLAHYRYVRFRERRAGGGIVEMSANRPFGVFDWPTWWVSLMDVRPLPARTTPVIRFRHIQGITTHMEVEWSFTPVTDGTRVTVLHLWNGPRWPLIGRVAARGVIGPIFVHGIASRTVAGLARAAEQSQTSQRAITLEPWKDAASS